MRDRIERAIEAAIAQALAEHEAAQPLDSADDFAALSARLSNAQAKIAAHARPGAGGAFRLPAGDGPARSGPAGITNQFRLPAGDDDTMTQATPSTNARAAAGAGGFLLPK